MVESLSSVLLRGVGETDSALESIFGATVVPPPVPKKRKADKEGGTGKASKRAKLEREEEEKAASASGKADVVPEAETVSGKKSKSKKPKSRPQPEVEEPPVAAAPEEPEVDEQKGDEDGDEWESDDDGESLPVHESLKREKGKKKAVKERSETIETKEERDARTVFIGNVPVAVAKTKSLKKQLIRHLTSFVPSSHIESIRFRSAAFKAPTAPLDADGEEKKKPRAQAWRETHGEGEAEGVVKAPTLSESEKKKVAFIKGEFHEEVDTLNAYAVFAHPPPPPSAAPSSSDPTSATDAVRLCVEHANGSTFLEHTLRVDFVGSKPPGWGTGDPRSTVFVGNLDYATTEEALRSFFHELLREERGEVAEGGGEGEGKGWVKSVRLVRDKATKMGKGFAYVLFQDRDCVDYVLAAETTRLKFAKRTLRVQRCRTVPAPKSSKPQLPSHSQERAGAPRPPAPKAPAPKGDPLLGQRLAGLDKDSRKAAKAADEQRIARRMAKKQAKAKAGVDGKAARDKMTGKGRGTRGKVMVLGRDRKRGEKGKGGRRK